MKYRCILVFSIFCVGLLFGITGRSGKAFALYPRPRILRRRRTEREDHRGKNTQSAVPVASTTKMVTALTARSLVQRRTRITITKEAASVSGAKAGLKAGEQYRFSDLLSAMLIRSANDAAVAIAIASSGSRSAFIKDMNAWCSAHALTRSHFADPAGLSPNRFHRRKSWCALRRNF